AMIEWTEFRRLDCFRWTDPLSQRVRRVDLLEQLADAEISELEIYRSRVGRLHLIAGKRHENVVQMDILMRVSIPVQVLHGLEDAPSDRRNPLRACQILQAE